MSSSSKSINTFIKAAGNGTEEKKQRMLRGLEDSENLKSNKQRMLRGLEDSENLKSNKQRMLRKID